MIKFTTLRVFLLLLVISALLRIIFFENFEKNLADNSKTSENYNATTDEVNEATEKRRGAGFCSDPFSVGSSATKNNQQCVNLNTDKSNFAQKYENQAKQIVDAALSQNRKGVALAEIINQHRLCAKPSASPSSNTSNCPALTLAYPAAVEKLQILANGGDMESEYFLGKLIADSFLKSESIDSYTLSLIDESVPIEGPEWMDRALSLINDSANQGYDQAIVLRKSLSM
ncbi:hypothetical protein [Ralstonia wenshanensis]|uniref:hypothetical protein n=1 Tax=Ralstonia wenshanensis TaxID=2842456 RepID=UPI002AACA49A|nr:hypothetical protein [Ralstonia wenshanensis]MDY7507263.1 hypothetical protein [Ralstonia wenshanensis]